MTSIQYPITNTQYPAAMLKHFQSICRRLFKPPEGNDAVSVFDPTDQIQSDSDELTEVSRRLNAAFLILLAGQKHPDYKKAQTLLQQTAESTDGSEIARFYLAAADRIHKEIEIDEVLSHAGFLKNLDVYVFTETDTQQIIKDILTPSALYFLEHQDATAELAMFGVDGEYGRHYSFLKAMAAFWHVFIEPRVKATFKIDLDQIFPQQTLVEQTGASAFEHFTTALWGANGTDSRGRPVELGMIAGALVNESDIDNSLFTPDVRFPELPQLPDQRLFFSILPQAISTHAEMMTQYITRWFDGVNTCIQRVHVTGGTNGIRIDSMRRHRPFTPSFIGRAEDQAYLLSAIKNSRRKPCLRPQRRADHAPRQGGLRR